MGLSSTEAVLLLVLSWRMVRSLVVVLLVVLLVILLVILVSLGVVSLAEVMPARQVGRKVLAKLPSSQSLLEQPLSPWLSLLAFEVGSGPEFSASPA